METQRFPNVAGRSLLGLEHHLPADFPADVSIAVIAFQQWHQRQVDEWIGRLAAAGIPDTPHEAGPLARVILEIPVLSGRFKIARRFIDGGMAASIRDPRVLARTITITIYGSVDGVCEPLGITSRENVSVRIVRRDGTVLWGCTGAVTDELLKESLAALPA
jgi:hypothetical protein